MGVVGITALEVMDANSVAELCIVGKFSSMQEQVFFDILTHCMHVYASNMTEKLLVERVKIAWHEHHFQTILHMTFGLGGLLCPG